METKHKKGGSRFKTCSECGKSKNPNCFIAGKKICKKCGEYKEGFYKPPRTGEEIFIGKFL